MVGAKVGKGVIVRGHVADDPLEGGVIPAKPVQLPGAPTPSTGRERQRHEDLGVDGGPPGPAFDGLDAVVQGVEVEAKLGIAVTLGISDHRKISSLLADLSPHWNSEKDRGMSWIEEQQMVVRYLRAHPGEAYFPCNPLAHLAVEGRLPHFEYGIYDRVLAGVPLSSDHLRRHIPPDALRICYPAHRSYKYAHFLMARSLPDFNRRRVINELPECVCFERSAHGPPHPEDRSGPAATTQPEVR